MPIEVFAMRDSFQSDDKIGQTAEAYADRAVNFARDKLGITLDWSDESISLVEDVLSRLHKDLESTKPTEKDIIQFAKTFGSYVGEVYRKNHGAAWGIITLQGRRILGLQTPGSGMRLWPWLLVQNRIMNGPQDNIHYHYQMLITGRPLPVLENPPHVPDLSKKQRRNRLWDLAVRCRQIIFDGSNR